MPVDAKELMKWQENLANTAVQRQVADMKAAGINPVLSAKFGGADTPSGAIDPSSGSSSGHGGYSAASGNIPSDGSVFGDLISGLNPNGTTRFGKVSIPNWVVQGVYQSLFGQGGSVTPSDVAAAVGDQTGTNVSEGDLLNGLYYDQNDQPREDKIGFKSAWNNFVHWIKGEGSIKNGKYYYVPTSARTYGNGGR